MMMTMTMTMMWMMMMWMEGVVRPRLEAFGTRVLAEWQWGHSHFGAFVERQGARESIERWA
jgi:hypothetical protein